MKIATYYATHALGRADMSTPDADAVVQRVNAVTGSNLRSAAMGHTENTAHNATVVEGMLDKLILKFPSHGGDI